MCIEMLHGDADVDASRFATPARHTASHMAAP